MDKEIPKSQKRCEQRRKWLKLGGAVAAVAALLAVVLGSMEKSVKASSLTIVATDEGELETTVAATGRVVPAHEEIVISPVSTRILEVYAQPGDTVKTGTPLVLLDLEAEQTACAKLQNQLDIARQQSRELDLGHSTTLSELAMQIEVKEMEVDRLRQDVANEQKLDSLGSGTGERVRLARTAYSTGLLELRQLRQRLANERQRTSAAMTVQELNVATIAKDLEAMERTLERGQIPAPRDGVLTFITGEIGAPVNAGERVAVVSDLSQFKVEGEVAEGSSDRVAIGADATVRVGKETIAGTVSNITPQSRGGTVQFMVALKEPSHPRLRSGLGVQLHVNYGYKDRVVRLPRGSWFKGPGDYQLFVVDADNENRLNRRTVRLGDSNSLYVEVVDGLRPSERVVVSDMDAYRVYKSLKVKQ